MALSTLEAILDRCSDLIELVDPIRLTDTRFRRFRAENGDDFREQMERAPDGCLRRFHVDLGESDEIPLVNNTDAAEYQIVAEIVVAYAQTNRAGAEGAISRRACIDDDWKEIDFNLGITGRGNFSGAHDCTPLGCTKTIEKGDGVDFLIIRAQYQYMRESTQSGAVVTPAPDGLVVIFGDSNAVGQGTTSSADAAFGVTTATATVPFHVTYATNGALDPPTMITIGPRDLQPYDVGAVPGLGVELTLGRELYLEGFAPYVAKFALNATTADNYKPSSTYPSSGGNLLARLKAYIDARIAESGKQLGAVVISLGVNDASSGITANAYQTNMTDIIASLRSSYGSSLKVVLIRVNSGSSPAEIATVRTAQAALDAADANLTVVDNDTLTLSDGLHYTSSSYLQLGQWCATALLDLVSMERRTISTAYPQVVGFGIASTGSGTVTPQPYGLPKNGDLEFLVAGTGLVDGAGVPTLSSAQGFTAVSGGESICQQGAVDENAKVWVRAVDQATLDANGGRMPAPTVADSNNINGAFIFTVRGPNALSLTNVDVVAASANNAFNTALTQTGVTTGYANELILRTFAAYSGTGNSASLTEAALTNVVEVHDADYEIGGGDCQMLYLSTGVKTAAGATGSATVASAGAAMFAAVTIGIRP